MHIPGALSCQVSGMPRPWSPWPELTVPPAQMRWLGRLVLGKELVGMLAPHDLTVPVVSRRS